MIRLIRVSSIREPQSCADTGPIRGLSGKSKLLSRYEHDTSRYIMIRNGYGVLKKTPNRTKMYLFTFRGSEHPLLRIRPVSVRIGIVSIRVDTRLIPVPIHRPDTEGAAGVRSSAHPLPRSCDARCAPGRGPLFAPNVAFTPRPLTSILFTSHFTPQFTPLPWRQKHSAVVGELPAREHSEHVCGMQPFDTFEPTYYSHRLFTPPFTPPEGGQNHLVVIRKL